MDSTVFLPAVALKSTVIFAVALLAAFVLLRASASTRYLVWMAALSAALAIPFLAVSVRPWSVALMSPAVTAAQSHTPLPAPDAEPPSESTGRLASWLTLSWLCGIGVMLTRIALGHLRMRLFLRRSREIQDARWTALLEESKLRIGLRRPVILRRSAETDIPLSYGAIRPVIVLPTEADEWTAERRGVVLMHELVHARRLDCVSSFIARISCAVYWFHPLAWLALSGFRKEQERSCDDAVVLAGTLRSAYAEHLVSLARSFTWAHRSRPEALGMSGARDLESRVQALLDPFRNRRAPSPRMCVAALSAIVALVVPLAAIRAQESQPVASLSGTVYDASGAAVPRANLLLKSSDGSHQEMARAGADGSYRFPRVAAGQYEMEVKAGGFAVYRQPAIVLNGVPAQVDVKLALGSITENVEVVGKGPRPAFTGTPHRIRVGGNVQATKLMYSVKPVYPADAQAAGIEGTVILHAVISIEGHLLGLSVINTSVDPGLAKAAMDAVGQWRYEPTLLNGVPVEVATTVAVTFRLEQ